MARCGFRATRMDDVLECHCVYYGPVDPDRRLKRAAAAPVRFGSAPIDVAALISDCMAGELVRTSC
eukprot:scaffold18299_cov117-Isochrysis_galbana.AAC.5